MDKVLLLGAGGQLGRELVKSVPPGINLHTCSHEDLDITDPVALRGKFAANNWDTVINAAAYTAVDKAETEPDKVFAVNAKAVSVLAELASQARFIHISTDFVFSGPSEAPYRPEQDPNPISVYAVSKEAGEMALQESHCRNALIVRTSWLYSSTGRNFVTTMLKLMREKDSLGVVNDQWGSPTAASGLSEIIWLLAQTSTIKGICHWSDKGVITWFDFAAEIQRQALEIGLLNRKIPLNPIPTSDYPTPARRPVYSALDSTATERMLCRNTRAWQEQLLATLNQIKVAESSQ